MKISSFVLLALTSGALAEPEHCGSFMHPLARQGGEQVGEITISDTLDPWLQISVDVMIDDGYDLTPYEGDDSAPTWITQVHATACCPEPSTVPCEEHTVSYSPMGVTTASFDMPEPDCGALPHDHEVEVTTHATIEKMGGNPAIHTIFPVPVRYVLYNDDGNNQGASYFDIAFIGNSPLAGVSFDGYCIDFFNGISTGVEYTGMAHSYLDVDAFENTNIDTPENLDLVAWAINNFRPGGTYSADIDGDGNMETTTLTSTALQNALWLLIGDDIEDYGPWSEYIYNQAQGHNGYEPPPGAYIPIVLLPDDRSRQHVIIEATCEQLQLPCDPITVSASADADARCTPDAPPGMKGDPHLVAFNGEYFEYMGACDLVLFRVPNFADGDMDLEVHVRTTIRYDYSYIEVAAIRLGENTLEVTSWGEYSFNDVQDAAMLDGRKHKKIGLEKTDEVSTMGGYPIYHTSTEPKNHRFDVVLPHKQNITITCMKDIVNVKLEHATFEYFGEVEGFLGNHHGDMLARDGVTDLREDINKLAEEWQVRDTDQVLIGTSRAPQFPQECVLPEEGAAQAAKEARRLGEGITEDQAKNACAHLKNNKNLFEACVYDVTATNNLDQAGAY